jgi:hypothetical protein
VASGLGLAAKKAASADHVLSARMASFPWPQVNFYNLIFHHNIDQGGLATPGLKTWAGSA